MTKISLQLSKILPAGLGMALVCGVLSGFIGSVFDFKQSFSEVDGFQGRALLALQIFPTLSLFSALLVGISFCVSAIGKKVGPKVKMSPNNGAAGALTLLAAPGLIYVAIRLFQGGLTSKIPAKELITVAVAAVMIVSAWGLFYFGLQVLSLYRKNRKRRSFFVVLAILAVIGASAMRYCDAHLYARLYLYLHGFLGVLTLAGFAFAVRLFLPKVGGIRISQAGLLLVVGTIALFGTGFSLRDAKQTVKVAVYERAATTANVLRFYQGGREIGSGHRPSVETRRLRYAREQQQRSMLDSDYPAFPGAHVVFISVDALRADKLGLYGNKSRDLSPLLDKWSETATVFERAYCAAPHSSYSITSLHTSHYIHDEAMLSGSIKHPTIAEILKKDNYESFAYYTQGIFFTEGERVAHYKDTKFGFDQSAHGAPRPNLLSDYVIAELDRSIVKGELPLFIWAHYFNVHEPYLSKRFGDSPLDRYEGEIFEADREVARLIDYIESKMARDTIIVFAADHGEEFKDHGGYYHGSSLFDEQVRVPLIIKAPGAKPGRIKNPVSLVDVVPTVLGILGKPALSSMSGRDLRPYIYGQYSEDQDPVPVFSSVMKRHMTLRWPWKLVAEPARGLFELYNLKLDPKEKINVYDDNKQLSNELLQEMYGWLDDISQGEDEIATALNLGRMQDDRSIPLLVNVALNVNALSEQRQEALDLLAQIRPWNSISQLETLLDDADYYVAVAAATALAQMKYDAGKPVLHEALWDDKLEIRRKAALSLGRLGDVLCVPVLIELLGVEDVETRREAIRLLGDLQDASAVEPLIDTIHDDRTRYLAILALGKIGDPRAFNTLLDVLRFDAHPNNRGYVVVAFGWAKMMDSVPKLLELFREEPGIKWTAEALVRLNAVGKFPLYGTDVSTEALPNLTGFRNCTEKDWIIAGEFFDRTTCESNGNSAGIAFETDHLENIELIVRGRHLLSEKARRAVLAIEIDDQPLVKMTLGSNFEQQRITLPSSKITKGNHTFKITMVEQGSFELDHFLLFSGDPT